MPKAERIIVHIHVHGYVVNDVIGSKRVIICLPSGNQLTVTHEALWKEAEEYLTVNNDYIIIIYLILSID